MSRPSSYPSSINLIADLISHNTLKWKCDLANSLFDKETAMEIFSVPVVPRGWSDKLIWHYDSKGVYSIITGYLLVTKPQWQQVTTRSSSSSALSNYSWKLIWNLKIHPKVKVFLWRAVLTSIVVLNNLKDRGLNLNLLCSICNQEVKTLEHAVFSCDHTRDTWLASPCSYKLTMVGFSSFTDWWNFLAAKMQEKVFQVEDVHIIAYTCWHIWKERCKVILKFKFLILSVQFIGF